MLTISVLLDLAPDCGCAMTDRAQGVDISMEADLLR